jgi:myo-inositol 2-dehydrogenase/D-chiro-inositol 1-dehydrogenase
MATTSSGSSAIVAVDIRAPSSRNRLRRDQVPDPRACQRKQAANREARMAGTLGFGVIGAGRIGRIHAASVAADAGARLVAIADPMADAAAELAGRHGADVRSVDQILASGEIEAVIIASPTDTHADLIERAARAGKAVFCEKPVDLDAGRVERCLEVVEATGRPLMIGFNRRFDPSFADLQRRVRAGAVGAVELVTVISRDPGPPPVSYIAGSGGLFRDMTIHDFDMARFLLGEEPVEVFAAASNLVDPAIGAAGDVDTALCVLRTASGKLCQISNSRRATYGYDQRIEVHGASGMLAAGNRHATTVTHAGADGYRGDPALHFFLERYADAYRIELAHFIACVRSGAAPSPGGHDGLMAQRLADAATLSSRTGERVRLAA